MWCDRVGHGLRLVKLIGINLLKPTRFLHNFTSPQRNSMSSSKSLATGSRIAHEYDPSVKYLRKVLETARATNTPAEVVEGLETALKYVDLREDYTLSCSSRDSDVCKKVIQNTHDNPWAELHKQGKTKWNLSPRMLSGTLEGQFLKSLVSGQRAKRVLEIGMYTGYSALSMAEALPADGELITLDAEPYLRDFNQPVLDSVPHGKKITIKIGNALDSMREMVKEGKQFDFVFVDAEKSEYIDYLKLCFEEGLLASNGTVAVDNAFRHGANYLPSDKPPDAARQFGKYVADNPSLHKVLIPLRDGILLVRRLSEVEPDIAH